MNGNPPTPEKPVTVTGCINPSAVGVTDACNHLWITPVDGVTETVPVMDDETVMIVEPRLCCTAGGGTIIDCQPSRQVRAGYIKIACKVTLEKSLRHLLEAAVMASSSNGCGRKRTTGAGSGGARRTDYAALARDGMR